MQLTKGQSGNRNKFPTHKSGQDSNSGKTDNFKKYRQTNSSRKIATIVVTLKFGFVAH